MQTLLVLLPALQHSDVKIAYRPITTVHSCLPIYFTHVTQKYSVYADLEKIYTSLILNSFQLGCYSSYWHYTADC